MLCGGVLRNEPTGDRGGVFADCGILVRCGAGAHGRLLILWNEPSFCRSTSLFRSAWEIGWGVVFRFPSFLLQFTESFQAFVEASFCNVHEAVQGGEVGDGDLVSGGKEVRFHGLEALQTDIVLGHLGDEDHFGAGRRLKFADEDVFEVVEVFHFFFGHDAVPFGVEAVFEAVAAGVGLAFCGAGTSAVLGVGAILGGAVGDELFASGVTVGAVVRVDSFHHVFLWDTFAFEAGDEIVVRGGGDGVFVGGGGDAMGSRLLAELFAFEALSGAALLA